MQYRCPIAEQALQHPDALAFSSAGRHCTYGEAAATISHIARRLQALGAGEGSRVAVLAQNSIEYALVLFALARISAVLVPLNLRLRPENWIAQLSAAEGMLVLTDAATRADAAALKLPLADIETVCAPEVGVTNQAISGANPLDAATEATILFTSGSTGQGKGVLLTLGNHLSSAQASNRLSGLMPGDVWLVALPFYHVGGMEILFRTAFAGACALIATSNASAAIQQMLISNTVTHLSLVGTQIEQLINLGQPAHLFKHARFILLGGAPLSPKLCREVKALNLPIRRSYGMTETASHVTCTAANSGWDMADLAGVPLSHARIRLLDPLQNDVPAGEIGEIAVAGPSVFSRYLQSVPQPKRMHEEYFLTGDMGFLDSEGELHVLGRRDGMFISGGENIYPEEIERAALTCEGVRACAVVAVDSAKWGARPLLFFEAEPGQPVDPNVILESLQQKLPAFKVPDQVFSIAELPRTAIGKVDYAALRQKTRPA